ncbi:hypothetical protein SAMN05444972_107106 [Marininema halotolerans]|uniref:Uncharacterized protein n=1 Tax=Marininema halotolerans TaxID=1155944 RepID=A0A1I6SHX7_9BACL|nr:hypothetical protein SAMN05444972_107106 [Marininema halotolerans]
MSPLIPATGSGIFILGLGLLVQKAKIVPEGSFFAHYFGSFFLMLVGSILFCAGLFFSK